MAVFRYIVRSAAGKESGLLTVQTRTEAEATLRARGAAILRLEQVSSTVSDSPYAKLRTRSEGEIRRSNIFITLAQQEIFLEELAALLAGGVPILSALQTIALHAKKRLARALFVCANRLSDGHTLTRTVQEELPFLGPVVQGLIAAGEANGDIDRMCTYSASLIAQRRALRSKMIQALMYPVLVVLVLIGVVTFLVVAVIPKIVDFLAARNAELPTVTQLLLRSIEFLQNYGVYLLAAPVVIGIAIYLLRRTEKTGYGVDRTILHIPIIGRIFSSSANALFCRVMGALLGSGINIMAALDYTQKAQKNHFYRREIRYIQSLIALGHPLSTGIRVSAMHRFIPMAEPMTLVGENTGRLDESLIRIANFSEAELTRRIELLSKLIEPALFLIVGAVVGFVYISFFMALMSASQGGLG